MVTITNSDNPLITVIISQKIEVLVNCTEFLLWQTLSNCFRMFLMFFLLSIRFCDISLKQEILDSTLKQANPKRWQTNIFKFAENSNSLNNV